MSPLKVFEYMASKRPIVVSDLPSLREVLDEKTAYFVEPGSSESLANVLLHTEKNKVETEEKARASFLLSEKYTWVARAHDIIIFIQSKQYNKTH
jgi:glycosyltransferase involved in cell wall biosynthesis